MATRQVRDAKDSLSGELIYFKGHAQAVYMSDGRTVEEAINSGGGSSGGSVDLSDYATKTELATKQDVISDIDTIRSNAANYKGTVTGVKVNGTTKNPSNGVVDIGAVITEHQDISGKQDKLVSGTNIKTINGASILGSGNIAISGGGSDSPVFITHFTVGEFASGTVEFTDEQVEAIIDAARQNKIIALPNSSSNGYTGILVSSYDYWEDEDGSWALTLTIIHNGASYSNAMAHHRPYFNWGHLTISSFTPLVETISVNEDGYAVADSYNKDNLIVIIEGECGYLQIGEVGTEYGMTIRFFTGEDCTIDYWGYWANGIIPTIAPYTVYEMSIVYGVDYTPCAVLTPFKQIE